MPGVRSRVGGLPTQAEMGRLAARALNLSVFRLLVGLGVTDVDVLGLRGHRLVSVEVKRRLHRGNAARTVLQLAFRSVFSDEVYLAIPWRDIGLAEQVIPSEYGIVAVGRGSAEVYRRSARFNPPVFYKLPVISLLGVV